MQVEYIALLVYNEERYEVRPKYEQLFKHCIELKRCSYLISY